MVQSINKCNQGNGIQNMETRPGSCRSKATEVVIPRNDPYMANGPRTMKWTVNRTSNKELRIGTWNARTMLQKGKLENLKLEMNRYKINILGVAEVRWKDKGDFLSEDKRVIYSGGERAGEAGVALILDKIVADKVTEVNCINDRLMKVKISSTPVETVIIQVYMYTSATEDVTVEELYEKIEKLINEEKGKTNIVIMGDWNAIVGEGKEGKTVGVFGLGTRNQRGEKLIKFCEENKFVVANTLFNCHKRRRYTWKSPGDITRNQIDYILVKARFRNGIKSAFAYPGADCDRS